MRTPLGRVRHHGSGHAGTGHFIATRVTSVALLFLSVWFVIAASLGMADTGYLAASDFLRQPLNALGIILFVAIGFYHMALGMQEVVADYIEKPVTKAALLLLNTLACLALAAGAIFAVLYIAFGA